MRLSKNRESQNHRDPHLFLHAIQQFLVTRFAGGWMVEEQTSVTHLDAFPLANADASDAKSSHRADDRH